MKEARDASEERPLGEGEGPLHEVSARGPGTWPELTTYSRPPDCPPRSPIPTRHGGPGRAGAGAMAKPRATPRARLGQGAEVRLSSNRTRRQGRVRSLKQRPPGPGGRCDRGSAEVPRTPLWGRRRAARSGLDPTLGEIRNDRQTGHHRPCLARGPGRQRRGRRPTARLPGVTLLPAWEARPLDRRHRVNRGPGRGRPPQRHEPPVTPTRVTIALLFCNLLLTSFQRVCFGG